MFGDPTGRRRRLEYLVTKFREKGATSPLSAKTPQELGLPPRFEEAMKRRLGASGIFVEVDGKYYLGESRLKQVGEGTNRKMGAGGRYNTRKRMLELRIARMILGVVVVALVLYDLLYVGGATLRYLIIVLLFVWVVLTLSQLYWLSRVRHRMVSGA